MLKYLLDLLKLYDLKNSILILLSITLFLFSCSKESKKSEIKNTESVSIYLAKISKGEISDDESLKLNDKSLDLLSNSENTVLNRNNLYNVISNYYSLNKWDKYRLATKKLLKYSLSSKDTINIANSYRSFGNYYFQAQILDSSFYYFSKSEKFYKKLNDLDGYSTILLKKGIIQYNINDFLGADLSLSEAYTIAKKNNNKEKIYVILNQLGLVSNKLREYNKALNYLDKALEVIRENNLQDVRHQESICLSNKGLVYTDMKDYNKAIYYYNLSLQYKNLKEDAPVLYSNIIDNLSYSKLQVNDLDKVKDFFLESLKIRQELQNIPSIITSFIHLSEYYYKIGDYNAALKYANTSFDLAKKSKGANDVLLSLKQMAIVDKTNASIYSDDYIRINDSLYLVERNSKDRFARIQLETDEIIKENSFLEEKNRNILNYFFASILIFSLLLYMRTQRSKNRYLIMEQAQQKANEDIYRLIISQQDKLEEGKNLEKSRIAKEIHDGILGRLFGLRLNLDGLNYKSEEEAKEERQVYLSELKLIEQDLREISHELSREKTVLVNNFLAILNRLFEEQIKINKAELVTLVDEKIDWNLLSNTTKINLYRIVQESLQNCNKYSKAKKITVAFQKDVKGNLILTIFDDGIGFEVNSKSKGIGLTNIVDRVHESLGTIDIISAKNKGTAITITVPLEFKTIKI